jgi:hypothetical protein
VTQDPRAQLTAAIQFLENELGRPDLPPRVRQLSQLMLNRSREIEDVIDVNNAEGRKDLLERGESLALWMRHRDVLDVLLTSRAFVEDEATGAVTLRWDLIAEEHRAVAVSFANEVVALRRGRSAGGRPKKA